ncbi:hypothetical protein PCANC_00974 [Puccinia coronata f. sp. avenae]|uniref:Uncharacterized protein n=1 Tax=Puccinia coronata f. sp. avenae TaxID=200324 RepID=A0A2N5W6M4_9BASI|nr:hypothetical protein PCANC_03996 [Puccinia coronata f. sp. avenae]PLW57872.1 hypothetical protein PCANC_00974 [Puccinia coronata f. sp. avenae]
MMILSKNSLIYVALRTLAASRLVLSAPSGPLVDVAEESLQAATDEGSVGGADSALGVTDLVIGEGRRAERTQDENAKINPMQLERKEICAKIRNTTKKISYKDSVPNEKLRFVVGTLQSVQELLLEPPKKSLESSGGSSKSSEIVKPYEGSALHGMSVEELTHPAKAMPEEIARLWRKSVTKLRMADENPSPESLRELECHSAYIEILFLSRSYMRKYKLESDILKDVGSFKPEELPLVIKSFVRSRKELLNDFESFPHLEGEPSVNTMLESGLSKKMMLAPENVMQRNLLVKFMMENKTLQPFHQEMESALQFSRCCRSRDN